MHQCIPQNHPQLQIPPGGWRLPAVGDSVLFRQRCAAPLSPAVVQAVDMDDTARDDANVWGVPDLDGRVLPDPFAPASSKVLVAHPNPNVELELPSGKRVIVRHIRYADSPGWAWPDQEN